jgi:septal ring factor EnvC (AmiA/AmiB activator)
MSNNYWDDEEDEDLDTDTNVQMDGSDLLKKLRKAKRSDEKRIKELTEQLESFTKVQRERTVKEILEQKGVNAKAARLVLKDLDEVTEESVNNWLTENGDLFGITQEVAESNQESDNNRAALRQQDAVTRSAITPDRANDLENRLDKAESAEEIIQLLYSQK